MNLKKLALNKKVVSNLEQNQVNGGTIITLVGCPVTLFCPTRFCVTQFNCETLNLIECRTTVQSINGPCTSVVDACESALQCPFPL